MSLREDALMSKLSRLEKKYFKIVRAGSGVLNLVGKPGLSKTSTLRAMAQKLNLFYVDLRLTVLDETDLGCYPRVREIEDNGVKFDVISYAIPDWAWEANKAMDTINPATGKPYSGAFIVFEELNRANITLRNAALKMLLEKEIGTKFKFKNNVFMAATGNLGAEDDTDVEEFDSALKSRLVRVVHDLPLNDWIVEYATENIHKDIINFLKHNPSFYYPDFKNDDSDTITNPRTWTYLSEYIIKNFGKDARYKDYHEDLTDVGGSFVHSSSLLEFLRYTKEKETLTYQDILKNKNQILEKEKFSRLDRDVVSRLLVELKELNILEFNKKEVQNLIKFLNHSEPEQIVTFLFDIVSDYKYDNECFKKDAKNNIVTILDAFPKEKEVVKNKLNS